VTIGGASAIPASSHANNQRFATSRLCSSARGAVRLCFIKQSMQFGFVK
jgi:hypothetical protein